jgi:hypothetical protein
MVIEELKTKVIGGLVWRKRNSWGWANAGTKKRRNLLVLSLLLKAIIMNYYGCTNLAICTLDRGNLFDVDRVDDSFLLSMEMEYYTKQRLHIGKDIVSLENLSWISNSLPKSQIKEDDVTRRRTGNFLPYEYVGQWRQNQKHDRYGVVSLKDGTKKIGGWAYGIVVSDKWWIGFDHSPASITKERVDWRTVHEDYVDGYLKVSSPASRSKKRKKNSKQQHESSSCYFSSVANYPAAATSSVAAVVSPTRASRDPHGHFLCIKNRTNISKSDHRQRSTNSSNNRHDTNKASDDINPGAVDCIVPNPAHISSSSTTQAHH